MMLTEIILTPDTSSDMNTSSRHCRAPPNSAVISKRFDLQDEALLLQQSTAKAPKICSINPGRSLELSTAIGLSKYSNNLRSAVEHSHPLPSSNFEETFSGGNMFSQHRGQLKSGRLRPLNLHFVPQLTSDACLGIVPVKARRTPSQHYRSLTAPSLRQTTGQTRNHSYIQLQQGGGVRRSYSAAVRNNSIGGSIIPLPMSVQKASFNGGTTSNKLLPVMSSTALQQQQDTNNIMTIKIQEKIDDDEEEKLPLEERATPQTESNNTSLKQHQLKHLITSPEHSNVYSNDIIHDSTTMGNNIIGKRRKPSGRRLPIKGGKLSFGWTHPTQCISPIVGSFPPITDSKKTRS